VCTRSDYGGADDLSFSSLGSSVKEILENPEVWFWLSLSSGIVVGLSEQGMDPRSAAIRC